MPAAAKNKILEATSGLVAILDPLTADERSRVLNAALTVLGENAGANPTNPDSEVASAGTHASFQIASGTQSGGRKPTEKMYMDQKAPQTKNEHFAVAARYREEHLNASSSTKKELEGVTVAARRDFDSNNFSRDLDNARRAGFFNRGGGTNSIVLSHYGQSYIDALPNRAAAKALQKPRGAKRKPGRKPSSTKRAG